MTLFLNTSASVSCMSWHYSEVWIYPFCWPHTEYNTYCIRAWGNPASELPLLKCRVMHPVKHVETVFHPPTSWYRIWLVRYYSWPNLSVCEYLEVWSDILKELASLDWLEIWCKCLTKRISVFLPRLMVQFYVNQWRCQIISIFEPLPLDDSDVCIPVFCSESAHNQY
jgi:hypothetical protein